MSPAGRARGGHLAQRSAFALLVLLAVTLQLLALVNMVLWRLDPDRGWYGLTDRGPHVVAATRPAGERAGLREGDRILAINGRTYKTVEEMWTVLDLELGHTNVYTIQRGEEQLTIPVVTGPIGMVTVLRHSGPYWLLGTLFVGLGVLVFLMKPFEAASWAFLLLSTLLGVGMSYAFPASTPFRPRELASVLGGITYVMPAAFLHLTTVFPRRWELFRRRGWLILLPYALGLGLAAWARYQSPDPRSLTGWIVTLRYVDVLGAILVFVTATLLVWLRSSASTQRLQALVICTGTLIAFVVPMLDQVYALLLGVRLFPDILLFTVLFLAFFPLSIGYAIARHDLFEIDVIVRRTYGYLLTTAAVLLLYGSAVTAMNLTLGATRVAQSPFFTLAFVLAVIYLMQPLQGRIQRLVDRAFYRQQYDYRATLTSVTEKITGLLDPGAVREMLVGTVVDEMFLENGVLLVASDGGHDFEPEALTGLDWPPYRPRRVLLAKPLTDVLVQARQPVFHHEIELAPQYREHRDEMQESFDELGAELMLPMVYQERVTAVLSLGRKKSGKMFTREDIDLLRTLLASSAVALENARLFDQVADSLKQIQLLETVKSNLAKFVPQTVQSLLEQSDDAEALFEKRDRDLTVMFADMTGYTRLSARLPIDEVNRIVERYFGAFLDEILRHGGDVNETAGDGLMVLFQDDDPARHAEAAVRAALGIQRLTREINTARVGEEPIGMHIGINSGVASVGATKIRGGAGLRWTYTASGPVTNIAARVGALGEEIAITEATRVRLGQEFFVEEVGPQSLKNVRDLVMVYRVPAPAAAAPEVPPEPPRDPARGRFVVHGTVCESGTGRVLPGLRVRAFDRDLLRDDFLGEATTDAEGRYEIRFTDEFFAGLLERSPDLYVRVFDARGERELYSTRHSVRRSAAAEERLDVEVPAGALVGG